MKKLKRSQRFKILLLTAFFMCTTNIFAQNVITGFVGDNNKDPLPGVSVTIKGDKGVGTITDIYGNYSIAAKIGQVLVFSYVGMTPQEIKVGNKNIINVSLDDDVKALNEVVVVGYGTQRRSDLTSAISSVSGKDLLKVPTMSLSNMVGNRVAGIAAVQASGQPGADQAAITVRGQSGIVYIIDGIRRSAADFNGIDPNEIESVTVLKDASSVAVYGLDANGAFIVTTKKGKSDKTNITYTGTVGISQNAEQQRWLDGPEYAYWYNKARLVQGDSQIFTTEMVRKMREGVDGWGNTNWYDEICGTGSRQHHNLSVSGGNDKIEVFASVGYLDERGNIKNYNYKRYNLRSNINTKISNGLTMFLGISGRIEDRDEPRFSADPDAYMNVPLQSIWAVPFVPKTHVIDGKEYNVATLAASSPVSPLTALNNSGYNRRNSTYVQTNLLLQYDAPWMKGLTFKLQGAYDIYYMNSKMLSEPCEVAIMNMPNANTTNLTYKKGYSVLKNTVSLAEKSFRQFDITSQASMSYNNNFGKHAVGVLVLSETRERKNNSINATGYGLDFIQLDELGNTTNLTGDGETKNPEIDGISAQSRVAGFVGRLNYNYADKYYIEGSVRYDGSYLFGGMNKRWVALPGVSMAWRVSNESWFNIPAIANLKLRGGIGKTATSGIGSFQWQNTMAIDPNSIVVGGTSQSIIYPKILGNPNLTWSQCLNYNGGLDATLWNGLLNVEIDVFYKYEYDKLSNVTGAYPPSMGNYYFASANVDKVDYKGYDITLSHYNKIEKFTYGAKIIWSYAYARWLKYAGDPDNAPDYKRLTGKQVGAKLGAIADGLFQNDNEIASSAVFTDRKAIPGYIKYKDLNGDGIITLDQDQGYFGKSSRPTHTGSLNLFGNWKGFDMDVLFSWGLGSCVALTGVYTAEGSKWVQGATSFSRPFYQGGNSPLFLVANAWTPDKPDATFPRLEVTPSSTNNSISSTFWYRNGNYARLKTIQIGYNFPQKWMSSAGIDGLRLYVEGYNLFTWSGVSKYNIDPELPAVNNGYYPQQRTYTIGLKLTL